jgi:hypothetical protein
MNRVYHTPLPGELGGRRSDGGLLVDGMRRVDACVIYPVYVTVEDANGMAIRTSPVVTKDGSRPTVNADRDGPLRNQRPQVHRDRR